MSTDVIYYYSWFRFDGLAMGALLAVFVRSIFMTRRNCLRLAGSAWLLMVAITVAGWRFGILTNGPVGSALRYTQADLIYTGVLLVAIGAPNLPLVGLFRLRVLTFTGKLSYCLYLIHLSLGDAYQRGLQSFGWDIAINQHPFAGILLRLSVLTVLCYGIAWLSFRYFEQPVLRLKRHFTPSEPEPAVPEIAAEDFTPSGYLPLQPGLLAAED
jgi:peptidoglycan/LPS O-acetylase OafA/YrhL